jgi:hypothetical protein
MVLLALQSGDHWTSNRGKPLALSGMWSFAAGYI